MADEHLLTVLRYVERNPVRAKLVRRAERWLWSSARFWQETENRPSYLEAGPVERLDYWLEWVNQALTTGELEALRRSVNSGTPFGSPDWIKKTAEQMGLEASLRTRGRPWKNRAGQE